MKWLLNFTLLLSILEYGYLINCPFADLQGAYQQPGPAEYSYSNAIPHIEGQRVLPRGNYGHLGPIPEGSLTGDDIDTLVQNYFTPGKRNEISPNGQSDSGDLDSIFHSFVGEGHSADLSCAMPPASCANDSSNYYYRTLDGSCNNLQYPGYGMAKTRYIRLLPPKYGDKKYTPSTALSGEALPNPRMLSLALYGEETLPDNYRTYMTMQFGQFLGHDISRLANEGAPKDCCNNPNNKLCYSIPLVPYGPISLTSGTQCLHFARSLSDWDMSCPASGLGYAEKISTTTAYLDLSTLYSNSLEKNIKLREFKGGLMKAYWYKHKAYLPIQQNINGECRDDNSECYNIPDVRNEMTPAVATVHTIFLREHNRLATILSQLNPHYSDEKLFQLARKINIAQYQKIGYYDWMPLVLGQAYSYEQGLIHQVPADEYVNDYDPSLESAAYVESSAAALRYSHTQVPGWISLVSPSRDRNHTLRLSDVLGRQENIKLLFDEFDSLVIGMCNSHQKRADGNIDKELKTFFNRKPSQEFGSDLKSLDIQRGRDYGLSSYNDLRQLCGLPRAYDWSGFGNEISAEKIALLQKFYYSPDDVDLSVGGSLETHVPDSLFGPTFQCIIGRQFLRTRRSDRFFFEREDLQSGFTREQLASIRSVTLSGILCANSNSLGCIQPNAFIFPYASNELMGCKDIPQLDLGLWKDISPGY